LAALRQLAEPVVLRVEQTVPPASDQAASHSPEVGLVAGAALVLRRPAVIVAAERHSGAVPAMAVRHWPLAVRMACLDSRAACSVPVARSLLAS